MCKWLTVLVNQRVDVEKKDLTPEERNLLSIGYKQVVGQRREAARALAYESSEGKGNAMISGYMDIVRKELQQICGEILGLLEKKLIPAVTALDSSAETDEARIFYLKLAGDYYRYLAESEEQKQSASSAEKCYNEGLKVASKLPPSNPVRLGLALNLSVCYFEILGAPQKALELARSAFDEAVKELEDLDPSEYKDATLIMQLLRDNISLWTQSVGGQDDSDGGNMQVEEDA